MRIIILSVFLIVIGTGCSDPVSDNSEIVSSETWRLYDSHDLSSYADIVLDKRKDSSFTCTGKWYYKFFDYTVTCSIMSGIVTKKAAQLTFNCKGTAAYPPDSLTGEVESSPFTLEMKGPFENGLSSGDWAITFTKEDWKGWEPLDCKFTGKLIEKQDYITVNVN